MNSVLKGRCLCGAVRFEVNNDFEKIYFCSCAQCRQITGSAFASNLFTKRDNFKWLQGDKLVGRYDMPDRDIAKTFCKRCGAGVPKISSNGETVMIPAGSLHGEPNVSIKQRIFQKERPKWAVHYEGYEEFETFPS